MSHNEKEHKTTLSSPLTKQRNKEEIDYNFYHQLLLSIQANFSYRMFIYCKLFHTPQSRSLLDDF